MTSNAEQGNLSPLTKVLNGDLRYKHVEAALANVLGVTSEDMGAFRARLRHLRNIGIPPIPKPGKGSHISYSAKFAIRMLFAMQLEGLGYSPERAKGWTVAISPDIPPNVLHSDSTTGDTYLVVYSDENGWASKNLASTSATLCKGPEELMKALVQAPLAFNVFNISASARRLIEELVNALERE